MQAGTPVDHHAGDQRYAIPEGNNFYNAVPGGTWAPGQPSDFEGAPDSLRTGMRGLNEYDKPRIERLARHQVEFLDGDGWTATAPAVQDLAPNPRSHVYPEPRATSRQAPSSYYFTRPFDKDFAERLDGSHFSMASNRRTYPIEGTAPLAPYRNTRRIQPVSWEYGTEDYIDVPLPSNVNQGAVTYEIPPRGRGRGI